MSGTRLFGLVAAASMLAACEARIGNESERAERLDGEAAASAEGKAEEGRFTLKAPGVSISVALPEGLRDRADLRSDARILPPDARFTGMHIEGQRDSGGVELAFTAPQGPDEAAAWYQRSERSEDFTISSARREGGGHVLTGRTRGDGDDFTVRLTPRADGGTEGRLAISDRR